MKNQCNKGLEESELRSRLIQGVEDFCSRSPINKMEDMENIQIYDAPLISFASAHDPLFNRLMDPDAVGPGHMLPTAWMPEAVSILSYFLPFSEGIRQSNYKEALPSLQWVHARINGERFNDTLRQFIANALMDAGYKALVPPLDNRFSVVDKRSNWSERHVAYIAGLGTFGLHKSLITSSGCAGRFGSIITDAHFVPVVRSYMDIYDHCNHCGECVIRCPSGAVKASGKDIALCAEQNAHNYDLFSPYYGCGKCQTNVPCEHCIP